MVTAISYSLSELLSTSSVLEMVDPRAAASRRRQQRSDGRRSVGAIIEAANIVLSERPDASMEEIALTAGVTRQTVYAHFCSRDTLINAVIETAWAEAITALDAAQLDTRPPADALRELLDVGARILRRYPLLLDPSLARTPRPDGSDPHDAVTPRIEQLIRRGQRMGHFDQALPADWLAAAVTGLSHTATHLVATGALSMSAAPAMLAESALRLCGAGDAHREPARVRRGSAR